MLRSTATSRGIRVALVLAVAVVCIGCGRDGPTEPGETLLDTLPIEDVLREQTPRLMEIPGVVGTAEGLRDDGTPCIVVMVAARTEELVSQLPESLGGHPVVVRATGVIEAREEDGD